METDWKTWIPPQSKTTTPWLRTNSGFNWGWHQEIFPETLRQETEFFFNQTKFVKNKNYCWMHCTVTHGRPSLQKKKKKRRRRRRRKKKNPSHKLLSKPNGLAACLSGYGAYREKTAPGVFRHSPPARWARRCVHLLPDRCSWSSHFYFTNNLISISLR